MPVPIVVNRLKIAIAIHANVVFVWLSQVACFAMLDNVVLVFLPRLEALAKQIGSEILPGL